jgi:hypothetical protein
MQELEIWIKRMTKQWDERFVALDQVLQGEQEKLKNKRVYKE